MSTTHGGATRGTSRSRSSGEERKEAEFGLSPPLLPVQQQAVASPPPMPTTPQRATATPTKTRTRSMSPAVRSSKQVLGTATIHDPLAFTAVGSDDGCGPNGDVTTVTTDYNPPTAATGPSRDWDLQMVTDMTPNDLLAELKQAHYRAESYKRAHDVLRQHLTASLQPARIAQLTNRISELEGHLRNVLVENKTLALDVKRLEKLVSERTSADQLADTLQQQNEALAFYQNKLRATTAHEHELERSTRKNAQLSASLEATCARLTERVQADTEKIDQLQVALAHAQATSNATVRDLARRELTPLKRGEGGGGGGAHVRLKSEVPPPPAVDLAALQATKKLSDELQLNELERRRLKHETEKQRKLIEDLQLALHHAKSAELGGGLGRSRSEANLPPRKAATVTATTPAAALPQPKLSYEQRQVRDSSIVAAAAARRLRRSEEAAKAALQHLNPPPPVPFLSNMKLRPIASASSSSGHLSVPELLVLLTQLPEYEAGAPSYSDLVGKLAIDFGLSAEMRAELEAAAIEPPRTAPRRSKKKKSTKAAKRKKKRSDTSVSASAGLVDPTPPEETAADAPDTEASTLSIPTIADALGDYPPPAASPTSSSSFLPAISPTGTGFSLHLAQQRLAQTPPPVDVEEVAEQQGLPQSPSSPLPAVCEEAEEEQAEDAET